MEENDSMTSKTKTLNYLSLLEEIDKLLNLSADSNNPLNLTKDTSDASKIDTICSNVAANIDRISKQMLFSKKAMFSTRMFNTVLRICATNESAFIISRTSFQSICTKLIELIKHIADKNDNNPLCASDILDSMLTNLAKDDLAKKCFDRFLSNETVSIIGNVLCKS
jgi:hypothetical protein